MGLFKEIRPMFIRWLERLFELTRRPSRALDLPRALLAELRRNKDQVYHARRGGPRTELRTTGVNLDCAFVKNALVYVLLKIRGTYASL